MTARRLAGDAAHPTGGHLPGARTQRSRQPPDQPGRDGARQGQAVTSPARFDIRQPAMAIPCCCGRSLDRLIADGAIAVRREPAGRRGRCVCPRSAWTSTPNSAARLERVDGDCRGAADLGGRARRRPTLAALQAVTGYHDESSIDSMALAAGGRAVATTRARPTASTIPNCAKSSTPGCPAASGGGDTWRSPSVSKPRWDADGRQAARPGRPSPLVSPGRRQPRPNSPVTARNAAEQSFALAAWSDAASFYDMCLAADPSAGTDHALLWRAGLAHFRNHDHRSGRRPADPRRRGGPRRRGTSGPGGEAVLALTKSRVTGGSWLGADIDLEPLQDFLRDSHRDTADLRARAYSVALGRPFRQIRIPSRLRAGQTSPRGWRPTWTTEVTAEVELALGIQHLAALQLDEAEEHLYNCERSAGRLADPWASSWAASRLPLIRWCRGDLAGADAQATRAAELAAEHFRLGRVITGDCLPSGRRRGPGSHRRRGTPGHAGQPAVPAFRLPVDRAHPGPGAGRRPGLRW